ncbi:thioredoxin family protein [Indibacter alkaliphilus LW1]|uniref:Thioredoxin family protein n=1 Tax=Indibacter alkaliphilus (strain CCUG 57479 / KCTC 22604 / LW1) TaxID=1189612 RepID=S2DIN8_INDAL|nr:thioredoxin family protein [Indibacter alkaliphilus LW1]
MIRERLLIISLRSAKVRIKGLAYRNHSLKDGSRHVCVPSYIKPKRLLGMGLILSLFCFPSPAQDDKGNRTQAPLVIYGEILAKVSSDTLELAIYEDYMGSLVKKPAPTIYQIPVSSGDGYYGLPGNITFSHTTKDIKGYAFGRLTSKAHGTLFSDFIITPGDTVGFFMDTFRNRLVFLGPNADKYKIQKELDEAKLVDLAESPANLVVEDMEAFLEAGTDSREPEYGVRSFVPYPKEKRLDHYRETLEKEIEGHAYFDIIESYKGVLDSEFLELLEINQLGKLLFPKTFNFNINRKDDRDAWSEVFLKALPSLPGIDYDQELILSAPFYTDYLLEKYLAGSYSKRTRAFDEVLAIENSYLRDRMISKFIMRFYPVIVKKEEYLETAFSVMEDSTSIELLRNFVEGKTKGNEVPGYKLTAEDGREVGLDDFRGKVVFVDFWFTGCHACVLYNGNVLTPVEHHFEDSEEVVFLGVSVDTDREKWLKSIEGGKYAPQGTTHLYTGGMGSDHPLVKYFSFQGFPSQVLLNREGKIVETTGLRKDHEAVIQLISDTINQTP